MADEETKYAREDRLRREKDARTVKRIIGGILAFFLACWGATSCTTVDTGEVGAVQHFGELSPNVLPEGIHFIRPWPFANVIPVRVASGPTEEAAPGASHDLQSVETKVTVQWAKEAGRVPCLIHGFGYSDGAWDGGIMKPAIHEVVKAVTAQYTADALIKKRHEVKLAIEVGIRDFVDRSLAEKKCKGAIQIVSVAITNFRFSDAFNHAIEEKVKTEQEALKAVNEKTKRITDAEADFQEKKLKAEAQAYTTETESKARAAAIEREAKALSAAPGLVELRIAERWDGKLPTYTGNSIPMLSLKGP